MMGLFGRAQRSAGNEGLENAVGASSTFTGTLRSDGGVRIDGTFEGIIEVAGNVVIGQGARVVADITARNITIGGTVSGNVDGTGLLQILSTGQVFGDICVASMMIDEGGVFQGVSRMRGLDQPALAPPRDDAASAPPSSTIVAVDRPTVEVVARPALAPDTLGPSPVVPGPTAAGAGPAPSAPREPTVAPPAPAAPEPAPPATDDLGLGIDLSKIDIEPTIPDVVIEEIEAPTEAPPNRNAAPATGRSQRRSGRRR